MILRRQNQKKKEVVHLFLLLETKEASKEVVEEVVMKVVVEMVVVMEDKDSQL